MPRLEQILLVRPGHDEPENTSVPLMSGWILLEGRLQIQIDAQKRIISLFSIEIWKKFRTELYEWGRKQRGTASPVLCSRVCVYLITGPSVS